MKNSLKSSKLFLVKQLIICFLVILLAFVLAYEKAYSQCGDVNGTFDVSVTDWTTMLDYLFITHPALSNPENSNCDGAGETTIRDAAFIADYIYISHFPLPGDSCPTNTSHYNTTFELPDTFWITPTEFPADDTTVLVDITYKSSGSKFCFAVPLKFTIDGWGVPVTNVTNEPGITVSLDTLSIYTDSGIANLWCYENPAFLKDSGIYTFHVELWNPPTPYSRQIQVDTLHLSNVYYPMFVKSDLSGVVPVFMGLGPQEPPVGYTTDTVEAPASKVIRTADLDRDNNVDLVFATTNDSTLSVAYGNGDGTFITPINLLTDQLPTGIAFGFIDDDTLLDIIAVDSGEYFVLLNLGGRGSFDVNNYSYPQGTSSNVAQIGYFNPDVHADFVSTPNTVFYGSAAGDFVQTRTLPVDFRSVDVGDFNNDGYDDLLLTILDDSVVVYLNDGFGDFVASEGFPVDPISWDTKTGSVVSDFNRDGNLDFAVLIPVFTKQEWGTSIYIVLGDDTTAVAQIDTVTINGYASNLEVADVNRDNELDLLTGTIDHNLYFLFSDGVGEFTLQDPVDLGDGVITDPLVYDDFDRDGNPDVLGGAVSEDDWTLAINDEPDDPVVSDEMVVTGYDNARIEVINPESFVIAEDFQTVSGARYNRLNADSNTYLDDRTVDYNLQFGEYTIVIRSQEDKDESMEYCSGIEINGTKTATTYLSYPWDDPPDKNPAVNDSVVFYYTYEPTPSFFPENGMKTSTSPVFNWSKLADSIFEFTAVDSFRFQLDNYYDFRAPRFDMIVLADSNIVLPEELHPDSVFYWRIKAYQDASESEYSRTFAIHVTDACCIFYRGNVNCSTPDGPDISDITRLIDFLYISHDPLCCPDEADVDGSGGEPDISDITYLIDHLYLTRKIPATCP